MTADEILLAAKGNVIVWTVEDFKRELGRLERHLQAAVDIKAWGEVERTATKLISVEDKLNGLLAYQRRREASE